MEYPYYIVTWQEGRLPCPPQYKGTVIERQFERGQIGGSRTVEKRVQTPHEALRILMQDRMRRTVYQVRDRGSQRHRLHPWEIERIIAEAEE